MYLPRFGDFWLFYLPTTPKAMTNQKKCALIFVHCACLMSLVNICLPVYCMYFSGDFSFTTLLNLNT